MMFWKFQGAYIILLKKDEIHTSLFLHLFPIYFLYLYLYFILNFLSALTIVLGALHA